MPFNTSFDYGSHWMLGIVLIEERTLVICNSHLNGDYDYEIYFNNLIRILRLNELSKGTDIINISDWNFVVCSDLAQQPNSCDCGVYVCFYVRRILEKESMDVCDHILERDYIRQILSQDYLEVSSKGRRKRPSYNLGQLNAVIFTSFKLNFVYAESAEIFANFFAE